MPQKHLLAFSSILHQPFASDKLESIGLYRAGHRHIIDVLVANRDPGHNWRRSLPYNGPYLPKAVVWHSMRCASQ
jgi:hypothetical protein